MPTRPLLEFQLAHAQARDAVQRDLDGAALADRLAGCGFEALQLHSRARDRRMFVVRPDLGRDLDDASRVLLKSLAGTDELCDCVFVVADGLSALTIETHAVPFLGELRSLLAPDGWRQGPVCIVQQGRVAVGDEVGALLAARMTVLLVGERPGLSSPDSLGVHLTWAPAPGRTNAERNCLSNIRPPEGLAYTLAAHKLRYLMNESRRRRLSGVGLKEDAPSLRDLPGPGPSLSGA